MNWKNSVAGIGLLVLVYAVLGCLGLAQASRTPDAKDAHEPFSKTVAGFKVRLVAVSDAISNGRERSADHAWTPDGRPYEGPEARLALRNMANAPEGGSRRYLFFEFEEPQTAGEIALEPNSATRTAARPTPPSTFDVFTYVPKSGFARGQRTENPDAVGPVTVQAWRGKPRDSSGGIVLAQPSLVEMGCGIQRTGLQPVVIGIAQSEYKVIGMGAASVPQIAEGQTAILASGRWGRIEVMRLPMPQYIDRPAATHRFRLLGGAFPPKTERKAYFYDSKGNLIASCGDGPNTPGSMGNLSQGFVVGGGIARGDIARYEVQERPYEFVKFDEVSFDSPKFKAYLGRQGLDHAVDSSIGKVLGVLKTTKDGPWMGNILYSGDGTRWRDPGNDLSIYENGMFDPWNHPLDYRWNILFEPKQEFSSSTTPTTCEVYAADAPDGPRKELLSNWNEMPFRMPMTYISCKPTIRPYIHVEIRAGEGTWRTVEQIPVNERMLSSAETGSLGTRVLFVRLEEDGRIRSWVGDENSPLPQSSWRPNEQRIRAIARLRSGGFVDADFNMGGFSGTNPTKNRYHGLEYTRQLNGTHVQSGAKSIDIKDIESFELQVQDLKAAITIPVHSPVD